MRTAVGHLSETYYTIHSKVEACDQPRFQHKMLGYLHQRA